MICAASVALRRLDVFSTGLTINNFDFYCAFTPWVEWWIGPYPTVSRNVSAALIGE